MPYPVQNLIEGRAKPVCVRPDDSVQEALRLMIEHDFSQLPVVNERGEPQGMVTHESILRALNHLGVKVEDLCVSNAIVRPQKYRPEDDLFDLLDRLRDVNAMLIVDGEDKLIGIVTSYDSMEYFRRRAEDMMLVEDIETMVKDLVLTPFTDQTGEVDRDRLAEAIEEATSSRHALLGRYRQALQHYLRLQEQGKPTVNRQWLEESFSHLAPSEEPKEFDDLTLYEYAELLLHKDRWDLYRSIFNLEAEAIRRLLSKVRETRNALAHFRGEVSPTQRDELRFCADWLAQHPAEKLMEHLVGIPVSWPVPTSETPLQQNAVREAAATYDISAQYDAQIAPTEEEPSPADSRYAPLAIWLQSQPLSRDRVQLTFQDVEEIIGGELPPSARRHRAWWANDSVAHIHSQLWLEVGWRVGPINMTEERVTFARIKERERAYIEFFSALQTDVREKTPFPLRNIGPDGQSWLTAATLPEGGPQCLYFNFSFARGQRFRVELYIDTTDQGKNKLIFDRLYSERNKLELALDTPISWERLNERRASRITVYHPGAITDDTGTLAQLRAWAADMMSRFYEVFADPAVQALSLAQQSSN